MRRAWRFSARLAVAGLLTAPGLANAIERCVVVAWDDPAAAKSFVAAIETTPPFDVVTPDLEVGADGLVRSGFGKLLHVSRATGVISLIDPDTWTIDDSFALGAASNPRDIAIVDSDTAYVTRRSESTLLRLDLRVGATVDAVDLSPLGVSGGDLAMETMLVHAGRLYVQLPRPLGSPFPSFVGVIDLATEQIVDADPGRQGPQAIALAGTPPHFKMQIIPGTNRLLLSATGSSLDFGGLETVDLDTLQSEGLVLAEFVDVSLNDLGPFAMIDSDRGWYSGSTDIVLSSHLHPFTLSAGGFTPEAASVLFYFSPHIAYEVTNDTIFWPVPMGLRAFDATTGAERTVVATALSGDPTDIALLTPIEEVPALHGARPALALALILAGSSALVRAGTALSVTTCWRARSRRRKKFRPC